MANIIKSVAQAIGIIEKEVGEMFDQSEDVAEEKRIYCVECNDRPVTHDGAHFCKVCAASFYNDEEETE